MNDKDTNLDKPNQDETPQAVETQDLIVDATIAPPISEEDLQTVGDLQTTFTAGWERAQQAGTSVEDWLRDEMVRQLPERDPQEVSAMSAEIIDTLKAQEEAKSSLQAAVARGRSKESWFADKMQEITSVQTAQGTAAAHMASLDKAVTDANKQMAATYLTQSGAVNQNPHLDGFMAERYHVETFNLNAKANGSQYRAEVLGGAGKGGYGKNSVDIVIKDANGKIVRRYQVKYGKDGQATTQLFENGDYRGQRKLVPSDQKGEVKGSTDTLQAPDGTKSNPLTRSDAKKLQQDAQSGKWNDLDWKEYRYRDLAIGLGKQVGKSALLGAVIGAGTEVVRKLWRGEKVEGKEVAKAALEGGADFGLKAAAAGALKVAAEKGAFRGALKGIASSSWANVAFVAVENAKILYKMGTGKLSVEEGLDQMEQTTVAAVVGLAAGAKGAAIGAAVGTMVGGPVGTVIGGFVGSVVGYMAGSAAGTVITKTAQSVRKRVGEKICSFVRSATTGSKNVAKGVWQWLTA